MSLKSYRKNTLLKLSSYGLSCINFFLFFFLILMINVTLLKIGGSVTGATPTIQLPNDSTLQQLIDRENLWQGIFKSLAGAGVVELQSNDVLTDGMYISFSPTETTYGGQRTVKKFDGANEDITMTTVTVMKEVIFLETTVPSVFTVADVLAQCNAKGIATIDGEEVGYGRKIGSTTPVKIVIKEPVQSEATTSCQDCDCECDEDDDCC